jgi:hypothetical protein
VPLTRHGLARPLSGAIADTTRPDAATRRTCSALVVSHHFDGLLRASACRSVAPGYREGFVAHLPSPRPRSWHPGVERRSTRERRSRRIARIAARSNHRVEAVQQPERRSAPESFAHTNPPSKEVGCGAGLDPFALAPTISPTAPKRDQRNHRRSRRIPPGAEAPSVPQSTNPKPPRRNRATRRQVHVCQRRRRKRGAHPEAWLSHRQVFLP